MKHRSIIAMSDLFETNGIWCPHRPSTLGPSNSTRLPYFISSLRFSNNMILMRSELNVTHSKRRKAEAFGDPTIAFISWWLLPRRVDTCMTRMLKSGYVTGWSPVRWPGGCAFPSLGSGWGYPWWCGWLPLPPCGTNRSPGGECPECLHWLRWWPTGEELRWCSEMRLRRLLSVSPTYTASQSEHWIWHTTPALSSVGTLALYQTALDGVVKCEVHGHSRSADGSADSVCDVPHVRECDAAFVPGGAGVLGDYGRFGFGGSNPGGLAVAWHTQDFLEVVYLPKFSLLIRADGVASVM